MKVFYCPLCFDLVALKENESRYCDCEASWGFLDVGAAICLGSAVLFVVDRGSLDAIVEKQLPHGCVAKITAVSPVSSG